MKSGHVRRARGIPRRTDALGLIEGRGEQVGIDVDVSVAQPDGRKRDAVANEAEMDGEPKRADGLNEAEEPVSMSKQAPVGESVRLRVARRAREEVCEVSGGESGVDGPASGDS